ncbi:MAG: glycoside hydrolase family 13 protein [Actinomycetota bacterium]|nr:glycoside hydrolase family 13 protein [Actinomycetota bacterium]
MTATAREWWRDAVVYQVYPRSFADSDGDGMGDIPGLISRLDYLSGLGVDAIWISPFYESPLHDGGYDVSDYRSIDSRLGTMADVDVLIAQAHERGIRILMDIVPNHTSSEHRWFQELLRAAPGSPAWDRYIVREGKADDGPPNNWKSVFHGRGWSRIRQGDGTPTGYWYLHLFDTTQPDVNWDNADVHEEFVSTLRFWFDRGIDGFRIDVAHGLVKEAGLPDFAYPDAADDADATPAMFDEDVAHAPFWDQDGVHEIYREWRRVADEYDPPRVFCGETWVPNAERLARYQRPDELHTSFNFNYLEAGWDAAAMRTSIDETIANHARVGAPPTWVLSNHDVIRHRTRMAPLGSNGRPDLDRGLRRARAATLFTLALPGSMYIYQGEELGLPEVVDLPAEARQDPAWLRSGGTDGTRDGCRVPIPWSGTGPSYGFGPGEATWLPQPDDWRDMSVEAQQGLEGSTLELYRLALRVRREEPSLGDGPLEWLDAPEGVLAFRRTGEAGADVIAVVNVAETPAHLPADWGTTILVASGDDVAELSIDDGGAALALGPETAAWVRG